MQMILTVVSTVECSLLTMCTHTHTHTCRRILQGSYKSITKRDFVEFRDSDGRDPFPGQVHDMTSGFAKNLPQTVPRSMEVCVHWGVPLCVAVRETMNKSIWHCAYTVSEKGCLYRGEGRRECNTRLFTCIMNYIIVYSWQYALTDREVRLCCMLTLGHCPFRV